MSMARRLALIRAFFAPIPRNPEDPFRDDLDVEFLPGNLKRTACLFYGFIDGFSFDFHSFHCLLHLCLIHDYAGCLLMYTCWPMLMMLLNSQ